MIKQILIQELLNANILSNHIYSRTKVVLSVNEEEYNILEVNVIQNPNEEEYVVIKAYPHPIENVPVDPTLKI
jgi:hypothetical protein